MLYRIVSDIPGRLRLRSSAGIFSEGEARGVSYALMHRPGVRHAQVHPANGSILIVFEPTHRQQVLDYVDGLSVLDLPVEDEVGVEDFANAIETAAENNRFQMELAGLVARRAATIALLPAPVQTAITLVRAVRYLWCGLRHLASRRLDVEVLDATAIGAALIRASFDEASSIMFLLSLSGAIERHVQSRTHLALKSGLIVRPERVWQTIDGQDVEISISDVREGQVLHLGAGSVLPVDGTVVQGAGELDEASMTGESELARKEVGSTVYAGTALETGDLYVQVTAAPGNARIDDIVTMVQGSSDLKAGVQSRAERLADNLVPLNLLAFFSILAFTGSMERAMTTVMVDYSCAIRLSTPVAVMSAMSEATRRRMVVKGGKYLEAFADADTVVFDKTGTLTLAAPHVEKVLCFGDASEDEVLRYAACIEEHFPHSVARAIMAEADRRGLRHGEELHADVEYVVAHGIATTIDGDRAIIGSAHFVFEDEFVPKPDDLDAVVEREAPTASVVYLARADVLVGAICVSDPIRPEAKGVLARLRGLGVQSIVMLTGDSERCAGHVAEQLGIDAYHAQVLPSDKSTYVNELRAQGHRVIMVGDGINDSPALAAADVSVAMSDASDIARAVADVAVLDSSLESLVTMRVLSARLMRRIRVDYNTIVGFNTALIALGVAQMITLTTAAYLHNASTFAITALNTRRLLRPEGSERL